METLIIAVSIISLKLAIAVVSCIVEIRRLKNQINLLDKENHEQSKELLALKKSIMLNGMAINDLADVVTSKTFNAFPLIGQSGNA